MKRYTLDYFPPIITLLLSSALLVSGEEIQNLFRFDRELIGQGELWRLLTCNFLHTNWNHLFINILGLFLIWSLFLETANQKWMNCFFWLPVFLNTTFLFLWSTKLDFYVGFSGALNGIIFSLALSSLLKQPLPAYIVLFGFSIKIIYEQFSGPSASISQLIEADVAIDAHLLGALSGVLIGSTYLFYKKITGPTI